MVKCEKFTNKYVSNEHTEKSANFPVTLWSEGKPDCMFFLTNMHNTVDCKVCIDEDDIEELIDQATMCPHDYSEEFEEFTEETGLLGGVTSLKGIQSTCRHISSSREVSELVLNPIQLVRHQCLSFCLMFTNVHQCFVY